LASALAVSTRSLQRKLKAITGSGPLELLRTVRLERAAALLERGACNVSEAAYRVGFSDPGTFSRAFRRHFGHAPSDHPLA
jgi:AraC-like DNA-binding protein